MKRKRDTRQRLPATLAKLEPVAELRRPFANLLRRIVEGSLTPLLSGGGRVVEIGCGDGQLIPLLPPTTAKVIHTEPLQAGVELLRRRHPERTIVRAAAQALPAAAASLDAVIGLCVLDVVRDLVATARELRRALRPGGHVVHFLDLTAELLPEFEALAARRVVPLPNVFVPSARDGWPQDLFLLRFEKAASILGLWRKLRCPAAPLLEPYFELFSRPLSNPAAAVATFHVLADDATKRGALLSWFYDAYARAPAELRERWAAHPDDTASSAGLFDERLRRTFASEAMEVTSSRVVLCAERADRAEDDPFAFRSLETGLFRYARDLPRDALAGVESLAGNLAGHEQMRRLGVHVFVARRPPG